MLLPLAVLGLVIGGLAAVALTAFLIRRALIRWADAMIVSFGLLRLSRRRGTDTHDCPPAPKLRVVGQSSATQELDEKR